MNITRRIVLKILKILSFNTNITHHHTGVKFYLNTYLHKGYWYHGKRRESESIELFKKYIQKEDTIIEIGGHIGYFTTFFASLVGKGGKVIVFEPGKNNLDYLRRNINYTTGSDYGLIILEERGVGNENGIMNFYLDPITGQNNSFLSDFDGFKRNKVFSDNIDAHTTVDQVDIIKLDSYIEDILIHPNFIKVDVEGFEWEVIKGMKNTLIQDRPRLMVEIQKDAPEIISFFLSINYDVQNDRSEAINSFEQYLEVRTPNIFFIPRT